MTTKPSFGVQAFGILLVCLGLFRVASQDIYSILNGSFLAAVGLGVILQRKWGRFLFLVSAAISVIGVLVDSILGISYRKAEWIAREVEVDPVFAMTVLSAVWVLLILFFLVGIFYFTRPSVKDRFR